ncbi:MAG: carbohydrate ABC transporter permease [Spirochaetia bacterium]
MMHKQTTAEKFFHGLIVAILILTASAMIIPFIHILAVSMSGAREVARREIFLWPKGFQLNTYKHVFASPQMTRAMLNTIYITVVGTIISVVLTAMLGYALSKKQIVVTSVILQLVVFTMLFKPGIIPTYLIVRSTQIIDTRWSLMLPVAIQPFNLIIMKSFFQNMPDELEESAIIDGAGWFTIFIKIVVPLSMAGLATVVLFYAVQRWNTFYHAVIYLNDMKKYPLQVVLRELVIQGTRLEESAMVEGSATDFPEMNLKSAVIMFAIIPILIVYPFLQRYFVKGVMIGGIKG